MRSDEHRQVNAGLDSARCLLSDYDPEGAITTLRHLFDTLGLTTLGLNDHTVIQNLVHWITSCLLVAPVRY